MTLISKSQNDVTAQNYDPDFDCPCVIGTGIHWEMEDSGDLVLK